MQENKNRKILLSSVLPSAERYVGSELNYLLKEQLSKMSLPLRF